MVPFYFPHMLTLCPSHLYSFPGAKQKTLKAIFRVIRRSSTPLATQPPTPRNLGVGLSALRPSITAGLPLSVGHHTKLSKCRLQNKV